MSQKHTVEDISKLVDTCDALIRAGEVNSATALVGQVSLSRVPRISRQPLAKICRRAGMVESGLRLLYPVVRDESLREAPATPGEICEYAFLLSRNGSKKEAISLLDALDAGTIPTALLYLASCEIDNWNYERAAGLLESYLTQPIDSYSRLIAHVNLSASYLALGRLAEAEKILDNTLSLAAAEGADRLAGNCLEQKGNLFFQRGDFKAARAQLNRALEIYRNSETYDQLLVLKWLAIMDSQELRSAEPLTKFREAAVRRRHWESVREADLFSLKVEFNQRLFDHLYYGSPTPGYRAWMSRHLSNGPSFSYLFGDPEPRQILDLATGMVSGAQADLNAGKKIHNVLAALARDFYLPQGVGPLFAEIYPGEYFNVDTSPNKIRQVLHRTRQWLARHGVRAGIECDSGKYRLIAHEAFAIRIPLRLELAGPNHARWNDILAHCKKDEKLTAVQLGRQTGLSHSCLHRFLRWALEKGHLQKIGNGKKTSYLVRAS